MGLRIIDNYITTQIFFPTSTFTFYFRIHYINEEQTILGILEGQCSTALINRFIIRNI